ncbi:Ankyrin repeat-containing domain [Pseudocohnilembus persalinus]|uniref:Ankyrin repeat-containing domain n=1 Tax=Pseudocohnilembus persalinus TaxID=266149 RepID=A0A0V0QX59_PSEPJ|nr:Ankyrin repeat-containing domain [Pseudocohnilembus persalinus]|eukprot:KRX06790.1 Ankyrin repeat-containing domain [Pseudocohnilembus persalinus]
MYNQIQELQEIQTEFNKKVQIQLQTVINNDDINDDQNQNESENNFGIIDEDFNSISNFNTQSQDISPQKAKNCKEFYKSASNINIKNKNNNSQYPWNRAISKEEINGKYVLETDFKQYCNQVKFELFKRQKQLQFEHKQKLNFSSLRQKNTFIPRDQLTYMNYTHFKLAQTLKPNQQPKSLCQLMNIASEDVDDEEQQDPQQSDQNLPYFEKRYDRKFVLNLENTITQNNYFTDMSQSRQSSNRKLTESSRNIMEKSQTLRKIDLNESLEKQKDNFLKVKSKDDLFKDKKQMAISSPNNLQTQKSVNCSNPFKLQNQDIKKPKKFYMNKSQQKIVSFPDFLEEEEELQESGKSNKIIIQESLVNIPKIDFQINKNKSQQEFQSESKVKIQQQSSNFLSEQKIIEDNQFTNQQLLSASKNNNDQENSEYKQKSQQQLLQEFLYYENYQKQKKQKEEILKNFLNQEQSKEQVRVQFQRKGDNRYSAIPSQDENNKQHIQTYSKRLSYKSQSLNQSIQEYESMNNSYSQKKDKFSISNQILRDKVMISNILAKCRKVTKKDEKLAAKDQRLKSRQFYKLQRNQKLKKKLDQMMQNYRKMKRCGIDLDRFINEKKNLFSKLTFERQGSFLFFRILKHNNKNLLEKMIDYDPGFVYEFDYMYLTPLHLSIMRNQFDIFQLLLERNSDIEALDLAGRPPLYYAIKNGNKEIVQILLRKGVDPFSPEKIDYLKLTDNQQVQNLIKRARKSRWTKREKLAPFVDDRNRSIHAKTSPSTNYKEIPEQKKGKFSTPEFLCFPDDLMAQFFAQFLAVSSFKTGDLSKTSKFLGEIFEFLKNYPRFRKCVFFFGGGLDLFLSVLRKVFQLVNIIEKLNACIPGPWNALLCQKLQPQMS